MKVKIVKSIDIFNNQTIIDCNFSDRTKYFASSISHLRMTEKSESNKSCLGFVTKFFSHLFKMIKKIFCFKIEPKQPPIYHLELTPDAREMFRRINEEEWDNVCEKIQRSISPSSYQQLLPLLQSRDYRALETHSDWPLIALLAISKGELNTKDYVALMLFDACKAQTSAKSPTAVLHNLENADSQLLIREGLKGVFTEEEIEKFLELIKDLETNDKDFYAVYYSDFAASLSEALQKNREHTLSTIEAIYYLNGFPLLIIPQRAGALHLILPPHLIDCLLEIKFPNSVMRSHPVNGPSKSEDFESATHRDVFIPQRFFSTPTNLHNYICNNPLDFYHHDAVYHLWLESGNPHRQLWIEIARIFKEGPHADPILYAEMINREFPGYFRNQEMERFFERELSLGEKFWVTLCKIEELQRSKHNRSVVDSLFPNVLAYIKEHHEDFARQGILIEDLKTILDKLPENDGMFSENEDGVSKLLSPLKQFLPN